MAQQFYLCTARISLLFLLSAGFGPCLAESPEDRSLETLSTLIANFHREIEEKVEEPYGAEVADLQAKYLEALRRSLQEAQEEGNLEVSLGFYNEIKRIESGQSAAESETSESSPPSLTHLREVYDLNLGIIEEQRNQRRFPIYRKMSERMTDLQEELTRAGRLEEALHVKKERESLLSAESSEPDEAPRTAAKPDTPELDEAPRMTGKPDTPEPDDELVEWLQSHELFWHAINANEVALRFEGRMVQVFADGRQIMEKELAVHGKNRFSFQWGSGEEHIFELSRNRKTFTRSRATGDPHSGEVRKLPTSSS